MFTSPLQTLSQQLVGHPPRAIDSLAWPSPLQLVVLAPHPDDFDAIAMSVKFFTELGCQLRLLVLSSGSKGVEDSYPGADSKRAKEQLREHEQSTSCRLFGLDEEQLTFLRLDEASDGELDDSRHNQQRLFSAIDQQAADILLLPYGEDSNSGHQRTYKMAHAYATQASRPLLALYNRDIKTSRFKTQIFCHFGPQQRAWKATLLRCHDSQQMRNLHQRGHGFDERILSFNAQCASELGLAEEAFAEVFQYEFFHLEG